MSEFHSTTICAVKKNGKTAIAGDGQVTLSESVIFKSNAKKIKKLYDNKVIIGFAGSVSDAFTLCEKFEKMLQKYSGNLMRSCVELAELWRNDKVPRKLDAMMIVCNSEEMFIVSGSGDVIDPEEGICAIGSGGNYAMAAARALAQNTDLSAEDIAVKALKIASEICVYTNDNITVEVL